MEKKRKKWVFLTALMIVIFFAGGCVSEDAASETLSRDPVPLEQYREVMEGIRAYSSVKARVDTVFLINNGVESLQLNMTTDIRQKGNDIVGLEIEMLTATRYLDKSVSMASYYTDGYFYTDFDGEKIKYRMSDEKMMKENNLGLIEIEEAAVRDSRIEYDPEGNYTITIQADAGSLKAVLEKYMNQVLEINPKNLSCMYLTVVVKCSGDHRILSSDTLVSLQYTEAEAVTEYTIGTYTEYQEINEKLSVDFPDLTEYREISAG